MNSESSASPVYARTILPGSKKLVSIFADSNWLDSLTQHAWSCSLEVGETDLSVLKASLPAGSKITGTIAAYDKDRTLLRSRVWGPAQPHPLATTF